MPRIPAFLIPHRLARRRCRRAPKDQQRGRGLVTKFPLRQEAPAGARFARVLAARAGKWVLDLCWYVHAHRTLLRWWSRSVTVAGGADRVDGPATQLGRGVAALAWAGTLGGDAIVVVLAAIGVIPSVVRHPPRGGSCQPSSTTGWRREACSHVTSTDASRTTVT